MPKDIYGYRIGSTVVEAEAPEGVQLVPDNKTLIAMPFNDEHDDEVDPVRLKSLKEIFSHYKPSQEVELKTADGESDEIVLKFNQLKDFTKDGIIEQSSILQGLVEQEDVYSRMTDVLQNNESLQKVLSNEGSKKEFIELLGTLIEELSDEND